MEIFFELSNYYQVFVIIMPRKKVDKSDEKDSSSNKKLGRPSGYTKGMEDTHPRLKTGSSPLFINT